VLFHLYLQLSLPTELSTNTCYLQYYIEYILAVQKKYAPPGRKLPLCIMTSGDTNARTVQLLEKNNHFGMEKAQITIVQQGKGVPALLDNDARFATEDGAWYKLQTKPHGHGDIHALLHSHRVVKKWLLDYGIEYVTFFQDTNGLAFHTLPLMLGVSKEMGLIMNSLAIPRKAKQAVGGITKLTHSKTGETK
jgi:UDP-sugar pyrophosphorylase